MLFIHIINIHEHSLFLVKFEFVLFGRPEYVGNVRSNPSLESNMCIYTNIENIENCNLCIKYNVNIQTTYNQ